jgi:hypothetical protein
VPVIGLVQVGIQSMADRYTYLPLIGLFIMLVVGHRRIWFPSGPGVGPRIGHRGSVVIAGGLRAF